MCISEIYIKDYLSSVLELLLFDDANCLDVFEDNIVKVKKIKGEIEFYLSVVNDTYLLQLLTDVKGLLDSYLNYRYIVLKDKKVRKSIIKEVKGLMKRVDSVVLMDTTIEKDILIGKVLNALRDVANGTDVRSYDKTVSNYKGLKKNLESLSNVADDMNSLDDLLHFIDTFLESHYLYLSVPQCRVNIKKIAANLILGIDNIFK